LPRRAEPTAVIAGSVFLRAIRGEDQGKGWDLDAGQVYVLGRSRRCNVRLTDQTVSGAHARVECQQGVWLITDLRSSHGTRVNEQKILAAKPLFDRDRIQLGKSLLEFRQYEQLAQADLAEIARDVELLE